MGAKMGPTVGLPNFLIFFPDKDTLIVLLK